MKLFIYQFNSPKLQESIYLSDEELTKEEIEEITPSKTDLINVVELNSVRGDVDMLPCDRHLQHSF